MSKRLKVCSGLWSLVCCLLCASLKVGLSVSLAVGKSSSMQVYGSPVTTYLVSLESRSGVSRPKRVCSIWTQARTTAKTTAKTWAFGGPRELEEAVWTRKWPVVLSLKVRRSESLEVGTTEGLRVHGPRPRPPTSGPPTVPLLRHHLSFASATCSLQFAKVSAATLSHQEKNDKADVQRGRVNISGFIGTVAT
jgi:hypothetical protein